MTTTTCPNCQQRVSTAQNFCGKCGYHLKNNTTPQPSVPLTPSIEQQPLQPIETTTLAQTNPITEPVNTTQSHTVSKENSFQAYLNRLPQQSKKILVAIVSISILLIVAFQLLAPKNTLKGVFWNSNGRQITIDNQGVAHLESSEGKLSAPLKQVKHNIYKLDLEKWEYTQSQPAFSWLTPNFIQTFVSMKLLDVKGDKLVLASNWEEIIKQNDAKITEEQLASSKELLNYFITHTVVKNERYDITLTPEFIKLIEKSTSDNDLANFTDFARNFALMDKIEFDANTLELRLVSDLGKVEQRIQAYQ